MILLRRSIIYAKIRLGNKNYIGDNMKKIMLLMLSGLAATSFAATTLDVNNLECHCEKHQMIFKLQDGESITEMTKHCMLNQDKKHDMVKFYDDNSKQTVKCKVAKNKLDIQSCQAFDISKHVKKAASQ